MDHGDVRGKFNENASRYDSQRRKLIPCFDDFYSIAAALAESNGKQPAILDIGAGTGLLSGYILEKFPEASMTLIDISDKMLEGAKERFQGRSNLTYIVADYSKYPLDKKYDIIVSALSIHHLTDEEKKQLYYNIYYSLNENGIFINADQVLGETPYLESLYKQDWKNKVENSGISKEALLSSYDRVKLDQMSTLADQLRWLKEIGFSDVDCVYKYYNFVVLFGRKA